MAQGETFGAREMERAFCPNMIMCVFTNYENRNELILEMSRQFGYGSNILKFHSLKI